MLKGWKFSVLGIVIVGITAAVAPQFGLIDYGRSISLFILFVLFVAALEVMERLGKRKKG
ncbi:hypothetical protein MNQ98_18400 [Paenibacillus sp. N3/727]|uniref:hypothetical protein n=1 Tax=Paenibacillus sp. N3/727 TaxID=2925845 RepID=UPI001F53DE4D|nr:hypothetical protein [Paenibacillus sp. N3/727]UNK16469.1 hypothetical protein MNQ98_18400 [Paenibacillus sp. N3/727]